MLKWRVGGREIGLGLFDRFDHVGGAGVVHEVGFFALDAPGVVEVEHVGVGAEALAAYAGVYQHLHLFIERGVAGVDVALGVAAGACGGVDGVHWVVGWGLDHDFVGRVAKLCGMCGIARLGARITRIGVASRVVLFHICLLGYHAYCTIHVACHG